MRRLAAAVTLALAASALGACESAVVRFAPRTSDWTVAGDEATWRADGVEVAANLVGGDGRFPVRGEIRCATAADVAFVPEVSSEGDPVGEIRVDGRTTPIAARQFAAAIGAAQPVAFALRPDVRWSGTPVTGSTVSYSIVVRTAAGEVRCPFLFTVEASGPRMTTLGMLGIGAATAAVLAAIVVGATGYFVATSF